MTRHSRPGYNDTFALAVIGLLALWVGFSAAADYIPPPWRWVYLGVLQAAVAAIVIAVIRALRRSRKDDR